MPSLSIDACQQCSKAVNAAAGLLQVRETMLLKQLLRNASSYLEWGAGTSTVLALTTMHRQGVVHTIENQDGWCGVMNTRTDMRCIHACTERPSRFQLHCVRDGAQLAGYHFDRNLSRHSVPRPFNGVVKFSGQEVVPAREHGFHYVRLAADLQDTFDLILVDGRWRVACAMQAWLLANEKTTVLFHDWGRKEYHSPTLYHFKVVDQVGQLAVLKPKHSEHAKKREVVWSDLLSALDAQGP